MVGTEKRLVLRVVLLQTVCAALAAALFGLLRGPDAARAGFTGGLIVAVGSAIFGWRMFAPGVAPAATLQRAMFAAAALKWCWYVMAVWVALTRLSFPPMPLLTGLVVAQFGYWIGLIGMKRG
ncbi:MAG: hypothetical protein NVSMB10_06320 [Steroidobacteraceae bacterium]